ncbi:porin, partial [Methylobacterium sp. J-067]|nr:porin [Methylobacterium sp. J-067]
MSAATRSAHTTVPSCTQIRTGHAFSGTGIEQYGRVVQYFNTDKAFVQFDGLTDGLASSFFDFYAHDFEFVGGTSGSDVSST